MKQFATFRHFLTNDNDLKIVTELQKQIFWLKVRSFKHNFANEAAESLASVVSVVVELTPDEEVMGSNIVRSWFF